MVRLYYGEMIFFISILWLTVRAIVWARDKKLSLKREAMLILVYICLAVVARFTFFPFSRVDGRIQPLVFDRGNWFPFRVNLIPIVYLMDYPERKEALLNLIGNTAMFLPLGLVWPVVYKKLDNHWKVIAAGAGLSLIIELLQLPFYDRVSDIDDLILNTSGFILGYLIFLLVRRLSRHKKASAHADAFLFRESEPGPTDGPGKTGRRPTGLPYFGSAYAQSTAESGKRKGSRSAPGISQRYPAGY